MHALQICHQSLQANSEEAPSILGTVEVFMTDAVMKAAFLTFVISTSSLTDKSSAKALPTSTVDKPDFSKAAVHRSVNLPSGLSCSRSKPLHAGQVQSRLCTAATTAKSTAHAVLCTAHAAVTPLAKLPRCFVQPDLSGCQRASECVCCHPLLLPFQEIQA